MTVMSSDHSTVDILLKASSPASDIFHQRKFLFIAQGSLRSGDDYICIHQVAPMAMAIDEKAIAMISKGIAAPLI